MNVVWWGNFSQFDGYGISTKDYVRALKKAGITVTIRGQIHNVPDDLKENINIPIPSNYVFVVHTFPGIDVYSGEIYNLYKKAAKNIYMTVWEGSEIPVQWLVSLSKADVIIVPSTFCKLAFEKTFKRGQVNVPIEVIPHIAEKVYEPTVSRYTFDTTTTNILALCSGTGYRKGLDLLIKAFLMEFKPYENVKLYIKSADTPIVEKYRNIFEMLTRNNFYNDTRFISRNHNIVQLTGLYSNLEIHNLYQQCDVFTMLSRGEGMCIPLAEAAVENRRVVYPAGPLTIGTQNHKVLWADDFLTPDNKTGYGVVSKWDIIDGHEFVPMSREGHPIHIDSMEWIEVLLDHARKQLRQAVIDSIELGKEVIHPKIKYVSEANVTQRLLEILAV